MSIIMELMEYNLYFIFAGLFSLWLVLVSFMKWDFWPFSHYPMFSKYQHPDIINTCRLALVTAGGEKFWWKPGYQHMQRDYPYEFVKMIQGGCDLKSKIEACRFIMEEDKNKGKAIETIVAYRRTIDLQEPSSIQDEVILLVPIKQLLFRVDV